MENADSMMVVQDKYSPFLIGAVRLVKVEFVNLTGKIEFGRMFIDYNSFN